jgi:recombinational DNA repair protein (RecF pathway)
MTESIEDEQKHRELFEDLQEHIHNNYVNAPRENYNP